MHPLRNFVAILVVTLSAAFIATPCVAAEGADAWAAGLKNLTPAQGQTLMKFARDLYPDERLEESKFTACLTPYDAEAGDLQKKEKEPPAGLAEADRRRGHADGIQGLGQRHPRGRTHPAVANAGRGSRTATVQEVRGTVPGSELKTL